MQARVLTDRYNKLKGQIDSIVRDANNEMSALRTELDSKLNGKVFFYETKLIS